jgi:heparosan-N-sulfate-glucuronate 5-epimerase
MSLRTRINYYRRIFRAYLTDERSHLSFWHEVPAENPGATPGELGPYYMLFTEKADYAGPFDAEGIPLLDYRGMLGLQYNPIAIAQYGLGNHNLWCSSGDRQRLAKVLVIADWLARKLERNPYGLEVWHHHFDWEYRTPLKAPWYSALAQGQGISLLVRAHAETRDDVYLEAARRAFLPLTRTTEEGGVAFRDAQGGTWLEEYIVTPPTHILNGFLWALWGVYDYWLATQEPQARALFEACTRTLAGNLPTYDTGYWSLYEHSGTRMRMLASSFYHQLHVVQLRVMARLSEERVFAEFADHWARYMQSGLKRNFALVHKSVFKLVYY